MPPMSVLLSHGVLYAPHECPAVSRCPIVLSCRSEGISANTLGVLKEDGGEGEGEGEGGMDKKQHKEEAEEGAHVYEAMDEKEGEGRGGGVENGGVVGEDKV